MPGAPNFAAHLVARDLDETAPVAIIGLWIGYPLWTAAFGLGTHRLAAHVMRLNMHSAMRRPPPLRVSAWTEFADAVPGPRVEDGHNAPAASQANAAPATPAPAERRLTSRQLQVVALLADGMRYREIAACLSISVRQVDRHVANTVARLGVRNTYELVAIAVAEGLVPPNADVERVAHEHAARGRLC